jgi:hypothetical protein
LREARAAEVCVEHRGRAAVRREKDEEILDPGLLERGGEMIHRRLGNIDTQDRSQHVHREICKNSNRADARMINVGVDCAWQWSEKGYDLPFLTRWSFVRLCRHVALARPCASMRPMVAANLSLSSGCLLLTYCISVGSELSSSGFWRYLYLYRRDESCNTTQKMSHIPPDQLVEDLDKLLYLIDLGGGLDLKEGEENVEEGVRIFEEFQGRSCLDGLVRNSVVVALGDRLQVLVHLVSEY